MCVLKLHHILSGCLKGHITDVSAGIGKIEKAL